MTVEELLDALAVALNAHSGSFNDEPTDFAEGYEAARIDIARAIATISTDDPRLDGNEFLRKANVS